MALLKRSSPWLAQPARLSSESSNATEDRFIVLAIRFLRTVFPPPKVKTRLTRIAATLRHDRPNAWTAPAATRRRSSATTVVSQCAIVFAVATRTKTTPMPKYFGALTIVILLGMVLTRVFLLKRQGIKAMKLGSTDKADFLLPPLALFYFYVLFAAAFDWPNIGVRPFFHSEAVAWTGVLFCLAGLFLFLWSLISFRQ